MLEAARRFATIVVLVHFLLLAGVIGVVAYASYHIYGSARDQAIEEAKSRQALLARQTASGVEGYYRSIMSDLALLERMERKDDARSATAPATQPGTPSDAPVPPPGGFPRGPFRDPPAAGAAAGPAPVEFGPPANPPTGPGGVGGRGASTRPRPRPYQEIRRNEFASLLARRIPFEEGVASMWRILNGRATMLFVYAQPKVGLKATTQPAVPPGLVLPGLCFPEKSLDAAQQLARDHAALLADIADEPVISPLITAPGDLGHGHLIAVPVSNPGRGAGTRVIVAFVPIKAVESQFFNTLNSNDGNLNAALLEKSGQVIIAIDKSLVGTNVVADMRATELARFAEKHILADTPGSWTVWNPSNVGSITLPPRVVAAEPVAVSGGTWTILIMSPLANIDDTVRPLFRGALSWAIFLSASITLIFVSTAFQLIRGRVRLERAQRELLTRELAQARGIQLAWLPDGTVPPPGLAVAATNIPASHISGDFYNWFSLPQGEGKSPRVAVCIGDVTGHGMSAAFLMATTQLLIRNTMMRLGDPGACLTEVNGQLCSQAFRGQFVTLLLLVIDPVARTVDIATAGHPGPLIAAGDGTREGVDFHPLQVESQYLLGVVEDAAYATQRFTLAPGSTLLLYTDGLVEAAPPDGPQFGSERLLATLRGAFPSLQAVLDALVAAIHTHTKRAELSDDVTMVALQLAAKPSAGPADSP